MFRAPLAASALGLALLLAGCGASSSISAGGHAIPETETPEALTREDFLDRIESAQLQAETVRLTLSTGEAEAETSDPFVEADLILSEDPAAAAMNLTMSLPGNEQLEMVLVESEVYLNAGEPTDHRFVRATDEMLGTFDIAQLQSQTNPTAQLAALDDALVDFTSAPGETIDGISTTAYTAVYDAARLAELDAAALTDEELAESGGTVASTLFVGPDDLPRRLVTGTGTRQSIADYRGWGEPITISAPAADDLFPVPEA